MEYAMVDATIVRVHRHGQGAKGGGTSSQAIGRSRGGLTTKILALTDALGNLVCFVLLPRQRHDLRWVSNLLQDIDLQELLADKVFDANWLIEHLQCTNCQVVIAQKANRKMPLHIDNGLTAALLLSSH